LLRSIHSIRFSLRSSLEEESSRPSSLASGSFSIFLQQILPLQKKRPLFCAFSRDSSYYTQFSWLVVLGLKQFSSPGAYLEHRALLGFIFSSEIYR